MYKVLVTTWFSDAESQAAVATSVLDFDNFTVAEAAVKFINAGSDDYEYNQRAVCLFKTPR